MAKEKAKETFNLAHGFVKMCKQYGLKFVFLAGMLLLFFIWLGIVTYDFYKINRVEIINNIIASQIEKQTEELREAPAIDTKSRYEATGKVNNIIRELLDTLDAQRVAVFEYHNGKDNTAGLPFLYSDMTYETCARGTKFISDAYCDMSCSLYQVPYYLYKHDYLQCSIEFMMESGKWPRFANKLEGDNVGYVFLNKISKDDIEIGYIMVNWDAKPDLDMGFIHSKISSAAMELNTILDYHKRHKQHKHHNGNDDIN